MQKKTIKKSCFLIGLILILGILVISTISLISPVNSKIAYAENDYTLTYTYNSGSQTYKVTGYTGTPINVEKRLFRTEGMSKANENQWFESAWQRQASPPGFYCPTKKSKKTCFLVGNKGKEPSICRGQKQAKAIFCEKGRI
jgi:hypothetical protein